MQYKYTNLALLFRKIRPIDLLVIVFLVLAGWSSQLSAANKAEIESLSTLPSAETYHVAIDRVSITGQMNEPVTITLTISPYPPPDGGFYSLVADVIEQPEGDKPKLLPSDREIKVWCSTPGAYLLRIRVNKIAKSSCGGAQADIIAEKEVRLQIGP